MAMPRSCVQAFQVMLWTSIFLLLIARGSANPYQDGYDVYSRSEQDAEGNMYMPSSMQEPYINRNYLRALIEKSGMNNQMQESYIPRNYLRQILETSRTNNQVPVYDGQDLSDSQTVFLRSDSPLSREKKRQMIPCHFKVCPKGRK